MLIAGTEDLWPTRQHHRLEPLRDRISYAQPLRLDIAKELASSAGKSAKG